jgi:hypothetical protein
LYRQSLAQRSVEHSVAGCVCKIGEDTRAVAGYHYSANWETCADGTFTRQTIN